MSLQKSGKLGDTEITYRNEKMALPMLILIVSILYQRVVCVSKEQAE